MNSFPAEVQFNKPWRPYQQRVLDDLDQHLADRHLHIVAAPGSGKTVLGLEVIRRLGKPALVLAPTLTIRDQWIDRLVYSFLPEGSPKPDWVTTDIRNPRLLTVTTYQALHCAYSGQSEVLEPDEVEEGEEAVDCTAESGGKVDLAGLLQHAGVQTLVVDEAHHLRSSWWRSLIAVKNKLTAPTVVALTATPPYDVSPAEWQRYKEMCGPVDAEIAVPELVLDGNLCPHQDYIYLNRPTREEMDRIKDFRANAQALIEEIKTRSTYITALESHPWLEYPENHLDSILSNPEYFSSIAVYANAVRGEAPPELLDVLGVAGEKIPSLDEDWLEVLLTNRLYADEANGPEIDPALEDIRNRLSRIGAVDRRQVYIRSTPRMDKMLIRSVSKLDSITDITNLEHRALGDGLRMVVLADFIRKSEMPQGPDDVKPLNRIGVVPIFEKIRRECSGDVKLGILSGSLVVIPASAEQTFRFICEHEKIPWTSVGLRPLPHDSDYLVLEMAEERQRVVHLVTRLFGRGGISVLVGTKSLLGEGWDAPSINSLVLASFVGSYMLSSQMRGRAIRSLPLNPDKTANIWHLVSVEPDRVGDSADLATLRRRFKAFVGVSFTGEVIEDGIDRMGIGQPPYSVTKIDEINSVMCSHALDRPGLRARWERSLDLGRSQMRIRERVKSPAKLLPRDFVFKRSAVALFWQAFGWGSFAYFRMKQALPFADDTLSINEAAMIAFGISAVATAPWCIKSVRLLIKHGPVDWSIRQIGLALLHTLYYTDIIKTDLTKMEVVADRNPKDRTVFCSLEGGTPYERSIYLEALQEILNPIGNPRYIIRRKMYFGTYTAQDYHAVPHLIGQKKEWAEYFSQMWKRYVGANDLIYTRNLEGRKLLLKVRVESMSGGLQPESERVSCWS